MYKKFYFNSSDLKEWEKLFHFCLESSNSFKIHFPKGKEDLLNKGICEFSSIPNVDLKPWDGMKDSIEVSGDLTTSIRDLFYLYEAPSYKRGEHGLWDFRLFKDERELLYVGDFTDRILLLTENELEFLQNSGISISDWAEMENL